MYFNTRRVKKNLIQTSIYDTKTLSGMLDVVIGRLLENSDCFLCKLYNCKDERCFDDDLCKNLLFDGILASYRHTK